MIAVPTSKRNTEPLWLPPPVLAIPRCCDSLFHNVVREPALTAWDPTRTTRDPVPECVRDSLVSKKK